MRWAHRVLGAVVPRTAQSARMGLHVDHRWQAMVFTAPLDILLGAPFGDQRCWVDQAIKSRT